MKYDPPINLGNENNNNRLLTEYGNEGLLGKKLKFQNLFNISLGIQKYFGVLIMTFPHMVSKRSRREGFRQTATGLISKISLVVWSIQFLIMSAYLILTASMLRLVLKDFGPSSFQATAVLSKIFIVIQGFFNMVFFAIFAKPFHNLLCIIDRFHVKTSSSPFIGIQVFYVVSVVLWPVTLIINYGIFLYGGDIESKLQFVLNAFGGLCNLNWLLTPAISYSSILFHLRQLFDANVKDVENSIIFEDETVETQLKMFVTYAKGVRKTDDFFTHFVLINLFLSCCGACCTCVALPANVNLNDSAFFFFVFFVGNFMYLVITFTGLLVPAVLLNEKSREMKWILLNSEAELSHTRLLFDRAMQFCDDYHWGITAGKTCLIERGRVLGMVSLVASALIVCVQFGFGKLSEDSATNGTRTC